MPNQPAPTMREIDITLARALRQAQGLAAAVRAEQLAAVPRQRSRTPGPNTYKRMSTGQLATAALAGMVIYGWSRQEEDIFTAELNNRGLGESLAVFQDPDYEPPANEAGIDNNFADHADALRVLTIDGLDSLAGAIDEVILGGDGRVPGALPPAEVIDDLAVMGADPEAIAAYDQAVGAGYTSPTDTVVQQAANQPATAYEQTTTVPEQQQGLTL